MNMVSIAEVDDTIYLARLRRHLGRLLRHARSTSETKLDEKVITFGLVNSFWIATNKPIRMLDPTCKRDCKMFASRPDLWIEPFAVVSATNSPDRESLLA